MSDVEQHPSLQARAFEEIIRIGKWIVSRRKLTRNDVFSNDIEPLIDELDLIHADFLNALKGMREGIEIAINLHSTNRNSAQDELKVQLGNCQIAYDILEKGRVQRRKLYEKSLARYIDLRTDAPTLLLKRAFILPSELELISKFYDALLAYFRNDALVYNHDMRNQLRILIGRLDDALVHGVGDSTRDLEKQLDHIAEMEKEFSANWAEAVRFRYQLESRLT